MSYPHFWVLMSCEMGTIRLCGSGTRVLEENLWDKCAVERNVVEPRAKRLAPPCMRKQRWRLGILARQSQFILAMLTPFPGTNLYRPHESFLNPRWSSE